MNGKIHTEYRSIDVADIMLYRCIADRMCAANHYEMVPYNKINLREEMAKS